MFLLRDHEWILVVRGRSRFAGANRRLREQIPGTTIDILER
jgi:hypothetical protein